MFLIQLSIPVVLYYMGAVDVVSLFEPQYRTLHVFPLNVMLSIWYHFS